MRIEEEVARYGKRPTNVSINEGLLKAAKQLDINLSATLEKAIEAEIRARRRQQWLDGNREALDEYNARVERDGVFSDGLRAF
ncbi:MAG TPA: type II toxin-antitoxin system CcdA family antitoxin [Lysobacter sp.]